MSEQVYTYDELAASLTIGRSTLEKIVREGRVKPVKIGRRVIFREHHRQQILDYYDKSREKKKRS